MTTVGPVSVVVGWTTYTRKKTSTGGFVVRVRRKMSDSDKYSNETRFGTLPRDKGCLIFRLRG